MARVGRFSGVRIDRARSPEVATLSDGERVTAACAIESRYRHPEGSRAGM